VPLVRANGVDIWYEVAGDPADRPVLLIHGHGAQLIAWHEQLVRDIVALGFHAITFDNRDVGASTHLVDVAAPDVPAVAGGDTTSVAYFIEDMADDAAMLLRSLGVGPAHVLGVSMGGMIAQSFAIRHPELTRTLTSVMSSPDPVRVGAPAPEVIAHWFDPAPTTRQGVIDLAVSSWHQTGSVELGIDEEWIRDVTGRQFDRSFDPVGEARQLGAIVGSPDRRPGLAGVTVPTLVVHGAIDPLVTVEGGVATAKAVPGAELLVIDKMGHDLPKSVWPQFLDAFGSLADG
jgi:pimeloyl-ACP methyl ester carboxylesterase